MPDPSSWLTTGLGGALIGLAAGALVLLDGMGAFEATQRRRVESPGKLSRADRRLRCSGGNHA